MVSAARAGARSAWRSQFTGTGQNSCSGRIFAALRQWLDKTPAKASSVFPGGRHRQRSPLRVCI